MLVSHVTQSIQDRDKYIPGMMYGLLSWGILDDRGLYMQGGNGVIKFLKPDGTIIIESVKKIGCLYYLNTVFNSPSTPDTTAALAMVPSFNLLHKSLAHPGKDALQLMIQRKLVDGLDDILGDTRGFDCKACIQGKMAHGSFQTSHEIATEHLGCLHSNVCGPM